MEMKEGRLLLIDGNSFCYRAFYAIRNLSNSKGQPTNAVYGFITMLNRLVKQEDPEYLCVAFDTKAPTFRHKKLDTYKITRKPMPDDLVGQMPIIKDVLAAYRIPVFEKEGYEADDVIATISKRAVSGALETRIVTGDKDVLQLVCPGVVVINTHKEGLVYDAEKVKERYGVGPECVVDLMALMGDQSDNYKGVPGIGEVAASELIKEFGSIDNLYKNLDKVKREAWRKVLSEHEADARLSRELAMLDADVPIDFSLDELRPGEPDTEKLTQLFRELEFRNLLKEVAEQDEWEADYETIGTKARFEELVEELKTKDQIAFDFETTSSDPNAAELVGVSFCWEPKKAYYVPLMHTEEKTLDREYALKELKPVFEDKKIKKIGQNIKYEKVVLLNYGIDLASISFDTMVASYLLNPSRMNHGLGDLSLEYLGHKMTPISDLIGKGKKAVTMDCVDIGKVARYCSEDSDVTFRLKGILNNKLIESGLAELFSGIEIPLIDVLARMEARGVAIDVDFLGGMSKEMDKAMESRVADIYRIAGCEFNINSPKQLSEVLFEKLRLPVIKRTKTGYSTDEEVLRKLAPEHTLPAAILEYRELSKLKTTYIDNLPKLINPKTGRLHTSFNQAITATGRLSSSQPNLQNIPIKRQMGRKVRRAFVPESEKYILMASDYSQIELRVLAHLSGDKNLIKAFENNIDIHTYTASLVNNVDINDVTTQMRNQAKTVNFGIIYGMSAFGLSKSLEIDPAKAQDFINAYFERYPEVKNFIEQTVEEARAAGYVKTLFNRRRYIPDITRENVRLRQFAERTAVNTPIQGTAADIIKVAMIELEKEFRAKKLASRMILQVHDELVFDVLKTELKKAKKIVKDRMEKVVELKVPVKTNITVGSNWLDQKELE